MLSFVFRVAEEDAEEVKASVHVPQRRRAPEHTAEMFMAVTDEIL
jgi:hypothetical protein